MRRAASLGACTATAPNSQNSTSQIQTWLCACGGRAAALASISALYRRNDVSFPEIIYHPLYDSLSFSLYSARFARDSQSPRRAWHLYNGERATETREWLMASAHCVFSACMRACAPDKRADGEGVPQLAIRLHKFLAFRPDFTLLCVYRAV